MVLDTSILLAIFFQEQHHDWAVSQMHAHAAELRMSTVNLTETLIHLKDRQPQLYHRLEDELLYNGIRFVTPDVQQAKIAADARLKYSLNLGDCFVYALAVQEDCPILTLDQDFAALPHPILSPKTHSREIK